MINFKKHIYMHAGKQMRKLTQLGTALERGTFQLLLYKTEYFEKCKLFSLTVLKVEMLQFKLQVKVFDRVVAMGAITPAEIKHGCPGTRPESRFRLYLNLNQTNSHDKPIHAAFLCKP